MSGNAFLKDKFAVVADDEPLIRELLAERLRHYGAEVAMAENGTQALALSLERPTVDLVVSDMRMPGGDGMTFLNSLKAARKELPPFIFVTGFSDFTTEDALKAGALAVFTKPFRMKELEATLRKIFNAT
jgi:DNA-binding response OmpR family regulator